MFPHINTMDKSHYKDEYYKFYNCGYRESKKLKWRYLTFMKLKLKLWV